MDSYQEETRKLALELAGRPEGVKQRELLTHERCQYKTKRSIYQVVFGPLVDAGKLRWVPYKDPGKSGAPARLYSTRDPRMAADYRRNRGESIEETRRDGVKVPEGLRKLIPDLVKCGITERKIADMCGASEGYISDLRKDAENARR